MKNELKIYKCPLCGNIVEMVETKAGKLVCCGQEMVQLEANTSDGAKEKHVPVVTVDGNKVTVEVGSVAHPMLDEHHIAWIILETDNGFQRTYLDHTGSPQAVFALPQDEKAVAAYEYCNLHGFWKVVL